MGCVFALITPRLEFGSGLGQRQTLNQGVGPLQQMLHGGTWWAPRWYMVVMVVHGGESSEASFNCSKTNLRGEQLRVMVMQAPLGYSLTFAALVPC